MSPSLIGDFQILANNLLTRDRSLLDTMTKLQDTCAKLNRTLSKSITKCGCISLNAQKQRFPANGEWSRLHNYADDQVEGELCPKCRDFVEQSIADTLFYLACVCNTFNISMEELLQKELGQLHILGQYNLK